MARKPKSEATPTEAPEKARSSLFERVASYLASNEWDYTAVEEKNYLRVGFRTPEASISVVLDVTEQEDWEQVIALAYYPVFIPEARRPAVLDCLNRLNYKLVFGSFEMDMGDGEIRFRGVVEAEHDLGERLIDRVLRSTLNSAREHLAEILAAAFAPETASAKTVEADRPEDATLQ